MHRKQRNPLEQEASVKGISQCVFLKFLLQLLDRSKEAVASDASFPPPFRFFTHRSNLFSPSAVLSRKFTYDSLKIEHQAGGAKTSDPVISKERDETLVLIKPADNTEAETVLKTIGELGVRNETEVSLFSWKDYVEYCEGDAHGQTQW